MAWFHYRTMSKREIDQQCYTHSLDITSTTLNDRDGETTIVGLSMEETDFYMTYL